MLPSIHAPSYFASLGMLTLTLSPHTSITFCTHTPFLTLIHTILNTVAPGKLRQLTAVHLLQSHLTLQGLH